MVALGVFFVWLVILINYPSHDFFLYRRFLLEIIIIELSSSFSLACRTVRTCTLPHFVSDGTRAKGR